MTYRPFFLMDLVGLDVILAIERIYFKDSGDPRDAALVGKVEQGELGGQRGRRLLNYPDPECARDDFLKG